MKIAVLVSGGVDSAVALNLLKDQGHDVTAFYLKIWLEDEISYLGTCPWQEDLSYVQGVCDQLRVPLEVVSLQKEYWDYVVAYTLEQAKLGRTPNPDIFCNKYIKFGLFVDYLIKHEKHFDKIASGHYAQINEKEGIFLLSCSADEIKDQTYFLSYLTQPQLSKLMFPIGHLTKSQVREYAQAFNLPNKDRKDSQGICFLGKLKFSDFLRHYLGEKKGSIVEYETGNFLGIHNGFWYYTIGQRQGLGLAGGPWYVVKKEIQKNILYVSRNYYDLKQERTYVEIDSCNWIIEPKDGSYTVKLRHGPQRHSCTLVRKNDDTYEIHLSLSDQGIASGQFAVFYDGDRCLGAGVIK